MLLSPGSDLDVEQSEPGLVESAQRAERLLADVRDLLQELKEKRATAANVSTRLARLSHELRTTCNSLRNAARQIEASGDVGEQASFLLTTQCPADTGAGPKPEQEAIAKETLAKIAAQLAGRSPDEKVTVKLAGEIAFDGQVWRYPDFIDRAERAFAELAP